VIDHSEEWLIKSSGDDLLDFSEVDVLIRLSISKVVNKLLGSHLGLGSCCTCLLVSSLGLLFNLLGLLLLLLSLLLSLLLLGISFLGLSSLLL